MSSRRSVLGWIVLRRDTTAGRWCLDFDGEVHTNRPKADEALAMALDAGHQAVLGEVTWVHTAVAPAGRNPQPSGRLP